MRILDSLSPWILAVSLMFTCAAFGLGARRLGALLGGGALVVISLLVAGHLQVSQPLANGKAVDLRVAFFNVLGENAAYGDRIFEALQAEKPDVVIIAEAAAIYPALRRFQSEYRVLTECTFEDCQMLVAVRPDVVRFWQLDLNPVWTERYNVAELALTSGKSVFVVGNHLVKPWLSGVSEPEVDRLSAQYDWLAGPVVAVGDYNMAPWSKPMRDLLSSTGFKTLRRPIATWPSKAGGFGVPIDHVLVHNGAEVVAARPFGEDLGSNHRGLIVDIALP